MDSETERPEELDDMAMTRLDGAKNWLVLNGIGFLNENDHASLKDKLIDDWLVNLWTTAIVDTNGVAARFMIKARGINYDLELIHSSEIDGEKLEFWQTQISSAEWATPTRDCRFDLVAVAPDGNRRIMSSSNRFQTVHPLMDELVLSLPTDDLRALYRMKPWLFPACFKDSGLSDTEIYLDEHGNYARRPWHTE